MKKTIVTVCAFSTLLMGVSVQGDDPLTREERQIQKQHYSSSTTWRASKLIGSTARDRAGETIGTVQDIVLDPNTGRATFAVVALDLPGHKGHYTAIPWQLVQTTSEPNRVTVKVDHNRITSAPMFTSTEWPTFEPAYTQKVYTYYNVDHSAVGGTSVYIDRESGTSYRGKENNFPRPQPDGREVFPELDERNKTEQ